MRPRHAALLPFLLASALAGGREPLDVASSRTSLLRCESGRVYRTFSPNTQSLDVMFGGRVHRLMALAPLPTERWAGPRFADLAYGQSNEYSLPTRGTGLELRLRPTSGGRFDLAELYRVQMRGSERKVALLDTCLR